jgi:hypothetical protein
MCIVCIMIIVVNVVAGEWSHRDGPLIMGAPLGDHCVPMNVVQGVIFSYSCIVDLIRVIFMP